MKAIAKTLVIAAALCAQIAVGRAANVDVSLNVFPRDLTNPNGGGTWSITAKTDSIYGISAINAFIRRVDLIVPGSFTQPGIFVESDINATLVNNRPPVTTVGGITNVLYGQNTAAPGVVTGVGTISKSDGPDPLGDPAWDNATHIFSGSYSAATPLFSAVGSNVTDANTLSTFVPPFAGSLDAVTTTVVRTVQSRPKSAALVDEGRFTFDPASGLRWLDLNAASNRTVPDVASQLGPGGEFQGLRYATVAELVTLFQHAGITDLSGNFTPALYSSVSGLIELLHDNSDHNLTPFYRASGGFTADRNPGDNFVRLAGIGVQDIARLGSASVSGLIPETSKQLNFGHWLVTSVPEPTTAAMAGIVALLLPWRRQACRHV